MQDRGESYLDRREQIRRGDKITPRPEQSIVTRIPNHTSRERSLANTPNPYDYRQALKVILETPQMDPRLYYATAGVIVTILASQLTSSIVKSRPFVTFADLLLFFFSLALAGMLVGIMLGESILPLNIIPLLLFALLGIFLSVIAIMLGNLLLRSTSAKVNRRKNI